MSERKSGLTPEQDAVVKHRGGALLVSAAAGSGKTRVLVERLLGRVLEGDGDIDRFLVITYTRAAANELREKILDEISRRLAMEPNNRLLRRQAILCHAAPISTIHAFCSELLRENTHAIEGLSPDFRVCDEGESEIIKASVLEDVLNEAYETIDTSPGFRALVDAMSGGRDDSRLIEIILDTHTKMKSNPNPEKWAAAQREFASAHGVRDASETVWGTFIMRRTKRTAEYWHGKMTELRREIMAFPAFEAAYGESIDGTIASLDSFISSLDHDWGSAALVGKINFPKAGRATGYETFKELRKNCKTAVDKLTALFESSSVELLEDMAAVEPAVTELLRIVLLFDDAYSREKKRRGVIDFSDQEHMALAILTDSETGEPTKLANAVSERYTEIMVDEYQDVNAVQEMIFKAVSRNGKNIFMVGDVKQSIYRFRLADPSIFLKKYRDFRDADDEYGEVDIIDSDATSTNGDSGTKILLSKNFRSRSEILDAVNFVFKNIMSTEFGEMEYTTREFLYPGRTDASNTSDSPVELCIIDMSEIGQADDEDSPVKAQIEAEIIAERIAELVEYGEISDGAGGTRAVEYSDIAILLRSMRDKAWRYAAALSQRGIPVDIPGGEGFFETIEVSAALSLLSVIDNPIQDIPLAAAMGSPVYGFTADELAIIRTRAEKKENFYVALKKSAECDEKCRKFLDDLDAFRTVMADMPADRFIWHVYNKTGMLAAVGAMRGGAQRRGNLIALADYARRFELSGYKGLFGFLTYITKLRDRGGDLNPNADAAGHSAVSIMSIHKSKGLEFPIVILADTTKKLNNKDSQKPLTVHPELGIGAIRIDRQRRIEYPTPARLAIAKKLTDEMMAEELRVLYVAMTRAKEKLIMTAAFRNAARDLEKLFKNAQENVPPQVLEETRSMAGWILLPGLTRPEAAFLRDNSEKPDILQAGSWDIRLINAATGQEPDTHSADIVETKDDEAVPREQVEAIREQILYEYPYPGASELPSKLTATELKGRYFDYEAAEEAERKETKNRHFAFERPEFIKQKSALTATERGTALHTAMQYIDFTQCTNEADVKDELTRLEQIRHITKEQKDAVDAGKIAKFFATDLGKRVLGVPEENLYREHKFSLLCSASEFYDVTDSVAGDKIMLQGVIDCYFEEDGEITVVDFKTDRVTMQTIAEKAAQYKPQLTAYAAALERMTGKSVKDCILYFFEVDTAIYIDSV